MKLINLLCVILLCALTSCNKDNIYKHFDRGFEDNRWLKTDVKTYDFTVADGSKSYDLILDVSHVAGYQFPSVPVKFNIIHPDKSITTENVAIEMTDGLGSDLGDCSGDYCDLQQPVFQNRKLAAGNYRIVLSNEFNTYLPNILGIGIKVNYASKK